MKRRDRGFTLVELMIVLAIIAVVATLAIVNMTSSKKTANHRSAVKTLSVIVTAQGEHKNDAGTYADLDALLTSDGNYRVPRLDAGEASVDHGYVFQSLGAPDAYTWAMEGVPDSYGNSGDYTFIVNELGIVWQQDLAGASAGAYPADPAAAGWTKVE